MSTMSPSMSLLRSMTGFAAASSALIVDGDICEKPVVPEPGPRLAEVEVLLEASNGFVEPLGKTGGRQRRRFRFRLGQRLEGVDYGRRGAKGRAA